MNPFCIIFSHHVIAKLSFSKGWGGGGDQVINIWKTSLLILFHHPTLPKKCKISTKYFLKIYVNSSIPLIIGFQYPLLPFSFLLLPLDKRCNTLWRHIIPSLLFVYIFGFFSKTSDNDTNINNSLLFSDKSHLDMEQPKIDEEEICLLKNLKY